MFKPPHLWYFCYGCLSRLIYMGPLFLLPNTGEDGEKGWLVGREHIILSTQLLRVSSAVCAFWWAFAWDTNISTVCVHSEVRSPLSSLDFLVTNIPVLFLPSPWPHISTDLYFWPSLTLDTVDNEYTALCSAHWRGFSFTTVIQGHPWVELWCASVHFQMVPAYHADAYVSQAWVFSSSVNWS